MKERLLKRIRRWNNDEQLALKAIDSQDYSESVRFDIEQLLNTRKGTVLINDEMGLPELTHLFNGFSLAEVDKLRVDISKQVKLFEPRLSNSRIEFSGDEEKLIELAFQMNAQLQYEKEALPFAVKIQMSESGRVSVTL